MAATKVNANWSGVAHGATSLTKITAVNFDQGGSIQTFAGDTDRYPTVGAVLMSKPKATITSADNGTFMGIAAGTKATLTATHKDVNLQSGGDILYTMVNAIVGNVSANGPFGQFGSATMPLEGISADGTTNPLSFTRA